MAQAVLDDGGFSPPAQIAFAVLSVLALAAAAAARGRAALLLAAHPVVGILALLGALGALSSLWTVGSADDALRWGLLAAGYAALTAAAAIAAAEAAGRAVILTAVCALAAVSGLVGLVGAATFSEPQAFRPTAAWRPAGTLEYAPALALLQVCALPALLRAMCAGGRLAAAAALGAAIAGSVLGMSNSRIGVALALLVCAAAILAPAGTVRASRGRGVLAVAVTVGAALAARASLGGPVARGADPGAWRMIAVVVLCIAAPAVWWGLVRLAGRPAVAHLALAATVAGLAVAGSVHGFAGSAALADGRGSPPRPAVRTASPVHRDRGELLHGRDAIWRAGVDAFGDRPLQGHGADAFFPATVRYQDGSVTAYAHDLPLELAVELGLGGLALALALYAACGRVLWRARGTPAAWSFGVPCAAFLAANLLDWPWHLAGMGAVWAAAAGALVADSG